MTVIFRQFLSKVKRPFVIVGALHPEERGAVIEFLLQWKAPVYLEALSGIREEPSLSPIRITYCDDLWESSKGAGYRIDGVLRIGGVPTVRAWRDLEEKKREVEVCSVSHLPFSGLTRSVLCHADEGMFLRENPPEESVEAGVAENWLEQDRRTHRILVDLLHEEPSAEPALIAQLSKRIPAGSLVYLGNSLPIREWDFAAEYRVRGLEITASRGLNGIDGQVSTFLGMASPFRVNCGIFGDLTFFYDLAAPWILNQLEGISVQLIVVNNSGGMIFSGMFSNPKFRNSHNFSMEHLARQWALPYSRELPTFAEGGRQVSSLIELVPDPHATKRFYDRFLQAIRSMYQTVGS